MPVEAVAEATDARGVVVPQTRIGTQCDVHAGWRRGLVAQDGVASAYASRGDERRKPALQLLPHELITSHRGRRPESAYALGAMRAVKTMHNVSAFHVDGA